MIQRKFSGLNRPILCAAYPERSRVCSERLPDQTGAEPGERDDHSPGGSLSRRPVSARRTRLSQCQTGNGATSMGNGAGMATIRYGRRATSGKERPLREQKRRCRPKGQVAVESAMCLSRIRMVRLGTAIGA